VAETHVEMAVRKPEERSEESHEERRKEKLGGIR
jgi:hypothetical protein